MSRYVTKPHGLVIGSNNLFTRFDYDRNMTHFPTILTFYHYRFEQINTLNVRIKTPAIQMLWETRRLPAPTASLFDRSWVEEATPNTFFTRFLNENCPGWVTPCQNVSDPYPVDYCLFLTKRKHALAICDMVNKHLSGMHFAHS